MAEKTQRQRGLEVQEDRAWQEKFWTAQRFGWVLMALIILAALLGATGKGGPFASASASTPTGTIEYPRITRWQSNEQLRLRLPPEASGQTEVELSRQFVSLFSIDSIEPDPSEVEATGSGHRFTFDVGSGGGEKLIVFNVRAAQPTLSQRIDARIGQGPAASMTLTVLP